MKDSKIIKNTDEDLGKENIDVLDKKLDAHKNDLLEIVEKGGIDFENLNHISINLVEELFKGRENDINFINCLNNFDFTIEQAIKRKLLLSLLSKMDPTTFIYGEHISGENRTKCSEKYLKQTIETFRNEINKAVDVCGLGKDDLLKMYDEEVEREKESEKRENIYKKIWPAYIQLRKEGYTNYDLTH